MAQKPLDYAVVRATAKAYNACRGNVGRAADKAGVKYNTFKGRVREGKRYHSALFKTFAPVRSAPPRISAEQAKAAWEAFKASGYIAAHAAKTMGLSRSAFSERVKTYARMTGVDLDALIEQRRSIADDVAAHRVQADAAASRARLKDAAKRIAELEDRIKDLMWAAKASFSPSEWTLPSHPRRKREHMPYLLTSDFQIGEVVRAEETEAGYGYNSTIFRSRYRRMIDTTIYLSTEHAGSNWKFPGIIYARGGDTISGDIHDELKVTNDLTPEEAVQCAFEEESAGIAKLADAFGRVEVKTPGAAGNHDRSTLKPWAKQASRRSYDRLVAFMLANHFKSDPRVCFQTSESFDVYFPIYNLKILLTHGDRMGSGGGQGFVGPAATIMRGVQKVVMEQAALGRHVDRVDHGHFHYPMYLPWVLSNGTTVGYSEYAKSFRMRPQPPQQALLYHHPRRGVVDFKPIILTED